MVDIRQSTRNAFIANFFSLATTSANDYYPFYSQHTKEYIGLGVYSYCKPRFEPGGYSISRYSDLFKSLRERLTYATFNFELDDIQHHLFVCKGMIVDTLDRPLFVLTVNDYRNSQNNTYDFEYQPDYSKFKLYVATDFITNPIYKNIWRKIDKEYVQECFVLGITVEFTTVENIENKIFSNEFDLKFNSISELQNILSNDVTPLLFENFDEIANDGLNRTLEENLLYQIDLISNEVGVDVDSINDFIRRYVSHNGHHVVSMRYNNNIFEDDEIYLTDSSGNTINFDSHEFYTAYAEQATPEEDEYGYEEDDTDYEEVVDEWGETAVPVPETVNDNTTVPETVDDNSDWGSRTSGSFEIIDDTSEDTSDDTLPSW